MPVRADRKKQSGREKTELFQSHSGSQNLLASSILTLWKLWISSCLTHRAQHAVLRSDYCIDRGWSEDL